MKEGQTMDFITSYINQYGYIVLFLALMLELLALPLPGELLMGYAGVSCFSRTFKLGGKYPGGWYGEYGWNDHSLRGRL